MTENQEITRPSAKSVDRTIEACREPFHAATSHSFAAAMQRGDTASPHLPACTIGAGDKQAGDGQTRDKQTGDLIKDNNAAVTDVKNKTQGWDSLNPPDSSELKSKIGDKRMILWGDNHDDSSSAKRLENALPGLKENGVDTVAMEGFREGQQGLINNWLATKPGSAEEKKLDGKVLDYLNTAANQGDAFNQKTMGLLHSIKNAGMKIICPEPDGGRMTPEGDGGKKDRDPNWARVTSNYLNEHPDSKVLFFAGSRHFAHHPQGNRFADRVQGKSVDLTPPSQYVLQ